MEINITEEIRKFVEEECKKPTSKYGYPPYSDHFIPMVNYAKKLAEKLNADVEIVELAGWLHDISSIICGRENHHITGAEIAEKKLKELNYPEEKIKKVKKCILNHRGSVNNFKKSIEEQIIADADAMSAYDDISCLFGAAFVCEDKSRITAKNSVKQKLINSWNKLSLEESKKLIKPKYEAVMLLLGD
ncbi:MAG: HD domain-containing protein [archaeon]